MDINKTINKFAKKSLLLFELIFAIVFSIPLIVDLVLIGNGIARTNIAKNGKQATATVITSYSNMEVNGEPYYTTKFTFTTEDGKVIKGKTDANPKKYNEGDTIIVRYNEKGKVVRADYEFDFGVVHIVLFGFGLVGVGFFIAIIFSVRSQRLDRLAEKKGKEFVALYAGTTSGVIVNGVNYYSLHYVYKDENGIEHKYKTHSVLTEEDVQYYKNVKKFKVKVYKKHVAISEMPDIARLQRLENEKTSEFKTCAYCGAQVKKSSAKCPNCGSSTFE